MKPARSLLIGIVALAAALLVCLAVALNPAFQTWIVQRELASRPDLQLSVGRVAAGFGRVELTDVVFERAGAQVRAPRVTAHMHVLSALWSRRLVISRLTAPGCEVRMGGGSNGGPPAPVSGAAPAIATASAVPPAQAPSGTSGTAAPVPTTVVAREFAGIFDSLSFPFDTAIAAFDVDGRVTSAADANQATIRISGGGLGAGRTASIDVEAVETLGHGPVKTVALTGTAAATMDSPQTFNAVELDLNATASGPGLGQPIAVTLVARARRSGSAERYDLTVTKADRRLLAVQADLPAPHTRIDGTWNMDVRNGDVSQWVADRPVPSFSASGEGRWEADPGFANMHAVGKLAATVSGLATLSPDLSGIGPMKVNADMDVARSGGVLSVTRLDVRLGDGQPVATIHALQPFQFNPHTGELRPTDAARELVGIVLEGVPLGWIRPFAPNLELAGGGVRGELVATPRAGGLSVRAKSPLTVSALEVSRGGQPLVRGLNVSVTASGDYAPQGWQAEVSGVADAKGAAKMLLFNAKAGQLAGAGQPVKATGMLGLDLGAWSAQPAAARFDALKRGNANVDFVASIGAKAQVQANVSLTGLAATVQGQVQSLPALSGAVRADIAADGHVAFNAPITLENAGQKSDLAIAGTFTPSVHGGTVDAQVTSSHLIFDDLRHLAVLAPGRAVAAPGRPVPPPWTGLNGTVAVQLSDVVYTGILEMTNVTGRIHVAGGNLTFDHLRAGTSGGGTAQVDGTIRFDPSAAEPFSVAADIALTDFDPGPLIQAANPNQPPAIEGRFTITTKVTAQASSLDGLPGATTGDFALTSKGGVFRGLSVNVGNLVENSGKLASWLASAGNAITSLAGRKDYDEITSRSEAANELAKILSTISYDQLGMVVSRDAQRNIQVRELTLISPEIRITGSGRARHVLGQSFFNDVVDLDLHLRARGRPAELMKYLGVLDSKPDDLGYAACTMPVKVEGSLMKPDTTQLSNRLVALAVEKTGLTEKAVDWINRLRGKSPN